MWLILILLAVTSCLPFTRLDYHALSDDYRYTSANTSNFQVSNDENELAHKIRDRKYFEIPFDKSESSIQEEPYANVTIINPNDTFLMNILQHFHHSNTSNVTTPSKHFTLKENKSGQQNNLLYNTSHSNNDNYLKNGNNIIEVVDGNSINYTVNNWNSSNIWSEENECNDSIYLRNFSNCNNNFWLPALSKNTQTLQDITKFYSPYKNKTLHKRRIKQRYFVPKYVVRNLSPVEIIMKLSKYYRHYNGIPVTLDKNGNSVFLTNYLETVPYDYNPIENLTNTLVKLIYDFSKSYAVNRNDMFLIFRNAHRYSSRGYVPEYVIPMPKTQELLLSYILEVLQYPTISSYTTRMLYVTSQRYGLTLKQIMPVYARILKVQIERTVWKTQIKYEMKKEAKKKYYLRIGKGIM